MAASQYDGQEASTETMKCMFMSQQQNARQNHHTEIPNEVLWKTTEFWYLGATLTKQNCIHKELPSKLKS